MNSSLAELIPRISLFQGFTVDGADMLIERGTVRSAAGEVLFREGDAPDTVLLVLTGALEVFVERDGRDLVLRPTLPGTILGELAVLCGMPRTASVRAVEPTTALEWTESAFRRLLLGNAFLSQRILGQSLRTLIEKERSLIEELIRHRS